MDEGFQSGRYVKQTLLREVGESGQRKLIDSSVGVLGTAVNVTASIRTTEGIKVLVGRREEMKVASLCGRNAFQITPRGTGKMRFDEISSRLRNSGEVKRNEWMLRFRRSPYELTVFQDGRTIVKGVPDGSAA